MPRYPASSTGSGTIEEITSTGDTITVTDPEGPITNIEALSGSGTVTTVSVVSANGLAGTVANPTTTPALTLETSVTGLLKGNGTAISPGLANTDYLPATTGSAIQKANGSGGLTAAVAGTDYLAGPLTGDVTTSAEAATLVGTTNVESIIRAQSLDQMTQPAMAVSCNSQRFTNGTAPVAATDLNTAKNALLAATYYEPTSLTEYTTTSTSLAHIDATNLTLSVTAISTVVVVELEAYVGFSAGTTLGTILWALFTHGTSTQIGYSLASLTLAGVQPAGRVRSILRVTGLTVGTAYQWDWAWALNASGSTAVMVVYCTTGVTGGPFGPAIMRAYAG